MLTETLMAFVMAGNAALSGLGPHASVRRPVEVRAEIVEARYEADARQVSNWRSQAVDALGPSPMIVFATFFGVERPVVTRCVKLNNYWCIKSARWDGEIGKDGEGHVGFVSAERGADAAAMLLRRYYLEFNRKSALDIVRRWAPPECGATGFGGMMLAVRGIGNTLRARYLAAHQVKFTAEGPKGGRPAGRVSIVIPRVKIIPRSGPAYGVPAIAVGVGIVEPSKSKQIARTPMRSVVAQAKPTAPAPAKVASATSCAPDEGRLRNYAQQMVEGLGLGPNDDLKLFTAEGVPLPNLMPVMLAMSGFELGMLRADPELVGGAIERATARVSALRGASLKEEGH
ncbi:hypothetical protein AB4072_08360 [Microvirga sp. 2MCAF38]|uniref:hypothetical protein n=1 Tax=Microvirga sp. 2MCAF38 TaxID=3232989 RepID=UPI003F9A10F6